MNKIGLYFFIIASMLAIIDGAFTIISPEMQVAKVVLLIFSGLIVGLLLFNTEKDFLIGGISFIFSSSALMILIGPLFVNSIFGKILINFILLLTPMVLVVAFKSIIDSISEAAGIRTSINDGVTLDYFKESSFERVWGMVVLTAVAFAILQLLLEIFYDISQYYYYLQAIDWLITSVFIVDLIVIYEKVHSFKNFLFKNYFDIIAAIPTVGLLRIFKLVRAIKLIKIFKSSAKLTGLIKLHKTSKFFSEESSINQYTKSITKSNEIKSVKKTVKKNKSKKPVKKKSLKSKTKSRIK